ncbi:MAG: DUF1127 domain-containing protein [Gammaproteobacteria bacterium]|nr:DUF1127 domain-containing protein [Gammaproteobacteria bacterium]
MNGELVSRLLEGGAKSGFGASAATAPGGRLVAWIRAGVGLVSLWMLRSRERRALARLDDRLLKDVGINPADAWEESRKPFWKS